MKAFDRDDLTNLKINIHLYFNDAKGASGELHDEYNCKSNEAIRNAYEEIKKDINEIEESINKKIHTINITMVGILNNKAVKEDFDSFHQLRNYLSNRGTRIIDEYVRECGFQLPTRP